MATLRQLLTEKGFDWEGGFIVVWHETEGDCPGWGDTVVGRHLITSDKHSLFDKEFDTGYGAPEMPRFIARDRTKLYFPHTYCGATAIAVVYLDILEYMGDNIDTPYCGG